MIKKLLTIATVVVATAATAQTNGRKVNSTINIVTETEISKSITYKAAAPIVCDTISTSQNASLTLNTAGSDTATPGCSPKAGFVFGTNCYGDLEKANYFPVSSYSALPTPSVTGVIVGFFKNGTRGTVGAPSTTVALKVYNGNMVSGPTGAAIAQTITTMAFIASAQVGTNTVVYYTFDFLTPVAVPNGFFASVTLPQGNGDSAVVFNSPASTMDYGYEKWSDNSWHSISSAWGASLKGNLAMYPKVCGDQATVGVSKSSLNKNISIQPNPSTGLVNVNVFLAHNENISLTVTNALGQQVLVNNYNNINNQSLSLDLTNQANGIYFVTVSNGTEKMVQRLIINK